ncbi:Gfo/Idh/MocA family oxidoreductase, partial [Parabacteroides sp. OttesenSCG-928-G21]|nr:Gfo/Idh/MocA family oxidoreductase [Parabacteroides sp. OttesenSCG-928-G21]
MKKIKLLLDSISTRPNKRSWIWEGSVSILSFILLHTIYILRFFSLQQILKKIYRTIKERKNSATIDKASKRVNVPPIFVEIYFILFGILLFILYRFNYLPTFSYLITVYFLIESSVWVLYYFVLRRFFEERYAIMHSLEYLLLIPIIIFIQGICVAIIHHMPLLSAIGNILNPIPSTPIYLNILNILYVAVVIGVVVSTLPTERVKEAGDKKYDISIIGAGEVVTKKLIPVIEKSKRQLIVAVYDILFCPNNKPKNIKKDSTQISFKEMDSNFEKNIFNSKILWISTPSHKHLPYLERYINKDIFLVIEKPLTSLNSEFMITRELLLSKQTPVFCLSYYYLEKALPLVYLFNPISFYEKYLNFSEEKNRYDVLA